jgi:hypothetical protein
MYGKCKYHRKNANVGDNANSIGKMQTLEIMPPPVVLSSPPRLRFFSQKKPPPIAGSHEIRGLQRIQG